MIFSKNEWYRTNFHLFFITKSDVSREEKKGENEGFSLEKAVSHMSEQRPVPPL